MKGDNLSLLPPSITCCLDLFQHPSPSSKPISTLGVFALGAILSGLDRERRYINVEIRYDTILTAHVCLDCELSRKVHNKDEQEYLNDQRRVRLMPRCVSAMSTNLRLSFLRRRKDKL